MTWLYLLAAIALCLAPLSSPLPVAEPLSSLLAGIASQTGVPNLVSGVILHTRLYDTVAEVVVFTLASLGVRFVLAGEIAAARVRSLDDPPSVTLCRLGATISALIWVELALRGHLSPGGGFAAGVAGGAVVVDIPTPAADQGGRGEGKGEQGSGSRPHGSHLQRSNCSIPIPRP